MKNKSRREAFGIRERKRREERTVTDEIGLEHKKMFTDACKSKR